MARRDLDELFGDGVGAPKPRGVLVALLLVSGLVLAILGMVCTAAPGGVLVLFAWMVAEKEMDRVDSGYLPSEVRPGVQRMRNATYLGVGIVIVLFLLQGYLFCSNQYDPFWENALRLLDRGAS